MKYLLALIALALSFNTAAQPQNFDAVQIKPVKVTDQIYMLEGEGGTSASRSAMTAYS